ncbi:substrate-binding domain-containing protein [Neorhizobium galegae]|uniref:substrate-binding domain-containing protein n=1 Tax=Neorhizobium galegae TaxID=399 RepID=UPI00128ACF90|nr:substrate-binding domain-containing protein [Neorhizobium galegae]KAA9383842.1 hypothetical protein F4V88_26525 [Neorhizobium galegae]KAB1115214.1 hypothetical protein F4V89_06320 [Neorhizobium galegae]MCM2496874.1 substrate-binding domain-containing protein [Neorhizobium galegae]MCQ1767409.1 substrate-binding domain-containing protein [Neorhizobium galegae]MCQ1775068.1 substrate-binding domain-containing protein [Neorhizobium galegae]
MERFFRQTHGLGAAGAPLWGLIGIAFMLWPTVVMADPIRGAGSTFAAPIIARWAENYEKARMDDGDFSSPDWTVDYELVGSLAGLMRLDQPELDFAAIKWPIGTSVEGTQDLIRSVQATKGAISYADFGQVKRANLPYAAIGNRAGKFVKPGPEGVRAAASAASWDESKDFAVSLTDQPAEGAYPIAGATFVVVSRKIGPHRFGRVQDFFRLAFEKGGKDAEALGYVPVTPQMVSQIVKYWLKKDTAASQ